MNEDILLKLTRGELGLLYTVVCEELQQAKYLPDPNHVVSTQLKELRNKIHNQANRYGMDL